MPDEPNTDSADLWSQQQQGRPEGTEVETAGDGAPVVVMEDNTESTTSSKRAREMLAGLDAGFATFDDYFGGDDDASSESPPRRRRNARVAQA
jgi:hypothetical protein